MTQTNPISSIYRDIYLFLFMHVFTVHSSCTKELNCRTPTPKPKSNNNFSFQNRVTEEWYLSPIATTTPTTIDMKTQNKQVENFPDNTIILS